VGAAVEGALRLLIGVGLDTALDVCEQIAEVAGTQLQAYTLQRMCGQRGAGRIATRYVVRKRRAESGEMAFEPADEFREHPVLPGGVLDEPDLSDQLAVEQQACHSCFSGRTRALRNGRHGVRKAAFRQRTNAQLAALD